MSRRTRSAKKGVSTKTYQKSDATLTTCQNTRKSSKGSEMEELEGEMPPVLVVVEQRAREEASLRALRAASDEGGASGASGEGGEGGEGAESDSDAELARALEALQVPGAAAAAPPAAAALLPRLAAAMPARRTTFLDEYLRIILTHNDRNVRTITDELMRYVERSVSEGGGEGAWSVRADSVVLSGWLALAAVWRAPRVPGAARALRLAAAALAPHEVEELARALYAALPTANELLLLSDAARDGAGGAADALAGLALRGALGKVCKLEVEDVFWSEGALSGEEAVAALGVTWRRLAGDARVQAVRVAGRALAGCAREQRAAAAAALAALLAAHHRLPPPHTAPHTPHTAPHTAHRHDPDFLKVVIALTKLQVLFKPDEKKPKK